MFRDTEGRIAKRVDELTDQYIPADLPRHGATWQTNQLLIHLIALVEALVDLEDGKRYDS